MNSSLQEIKNWGKDLALRLFIKAKTPIYPGAAKREMRCKNFKRRRIV